MPSPISTLWLRFQVFQNGGCSVVLSAQTIVINEFPVRSGGGKANGGLNLASCEKV
jgi:hypothetical protein